MSYRRYPQSLQSNRRNPYQKEEEGVKEPTNSLFAAEDADLSGTINDIPLPTDLEVPFPIPRKTNRPSIINFIKDNIHIEEIILIGLIIILLSEGIGDEILILLLVYLLIT